MSADDAVSYYIGKAGRARLNCGQSVIKAFRDKFGLDENAVDLFRSYGSGKAPDGLCGAVYAAKFIFDGLRTDVLKRCEDAMIENAGSTKCKEIRSLRRLSCQGCIKTVADIIEKA